VHPIAAMEVEYSMFSLDIESERTELLATCRELGVAVVAYSPLGRGMLTGRYRTAGDLGRGMGGGSSRGLVRRTLGGIWNWWRR
jgi:aryl-alcohol dehydrogenase-like predicted oxidoreductase